MVADLRVYLLGEFRLYRNGVLISSTEWHTRQARQLFKLLFTERGRTVPADKIEAWLWPEYPHSAGKTLRSAISTLRTVLEPDRKPQTTSRFVPRGHAGYQLSFPDDASVWVDTIEFERLLEAAYTANTANNAHRFQLLQAALQLYVGDYLVEDEAASWLQAERARLRDRYCVGAYTLATWHYAEQRYNESIAVCSDGIRVDSYHEPFYRLIMQSQAALGATASALKTFERCLEMLDDVFGADPAAQTLQLHQAIVKGVFRAQPPVRDPAVAQPAQENQLTSTGENLGGDQHAITPLTLPIDATPPAFIGRTTELTWFAQQLGMVQRQPPQSTLTVALVGEAGIGKTALVGCFARLAHAQHIPVIKTSCQAIEQHVPFASLVAMLSAWIRDASDGQLHSLSRTPLAYLASLLPALRDRLADLPVVLDIQTEQTHRVLVTGVVEIVAALCRQHPLMLVWDDLQWADESTLQVINRLALLERVPLLLLLTYRPEDLGENTLLESMMRYLGRNERMTTLSLARFSASEVAEYLRLHNAVLSLSVEQLCSLTQGNALFLSETVRVLLEQASHNPLVQDQLQGDELRHLILHAHQLRDVVLARVVRLPQDAIELLNLAAVIGRPFTLDLLRPQLSERDSETLDLLLARKFLVEMPGTTDGELRLAFSHELVGQIIYAACSSLKLMRLHQQVAAHLVQRYSAAPLEPAVEIAFHYRRAGAAFRFEVLRYEVAAGDYARRSFSYKQALVHYDAALEVLKQGPLPVRNQHAPNISEWVERAYYGRRIACEALLDWAGVQESHRALSSWAFANKQTMLASMSMHRMAIIRSLIGYPSEAAKLSAAFIQHLQTGTQSELGATDRDYARLKAMIDMEQRWVTLLTVAPVYETDRTADEALHRAHFPVFHLAPPPEIEDWNELAAMVGQAAAAFMLTQYGWVLLLQGRNADAERCLHTALRAAEETDQVVSWVLAAMLLSRVYELYQQPERATAWFERCIQRSRQVLEAPWLLMWPLLTLAYRSIETGRVDVAEQVLQEVQSQLTQHSDFTAHRYSTQIAFGLLARAHTDIAGAEELLRKALAHQDNLYIEVHGLAILGLADIARQYGRYDEARRHYWYMLGFSSKRSLLQIYSRTALALAEMALATGEIQGITRLLSQLEPLLTQVGYVGMAKECRALLAQLHKSEQLSTQERVEAYH